MNNHTDTLKNIIAHTMRQLDEIDQRAAFAGEIEAAYARDILELAAKLHERIDKRMRNRLRAQQQKQAIDAMNGDNLLTDAAVACVTDAVAGQQRAIREETTR